MVRKLTRDALESEIHGLSGLISALDPGDELGRISLNSRLEDLKDELRQLGDAIRTNGSVILSFEGSPVTGSRGIDAEFAANVLRDYQDLIAKQLIATDNGGLAQRGPVPSRDLAKLQITNLVHGSFGFQLEESRKDEPEFIDSAVKKSIHAVDNLLYAFSSNNYDTFNDALSTVDRRVFISIQSFFSSMYRDSAELKIIEEDRDFIIDRQAVSIARDRVTGIDFVDEEFYDRGELLGLVPIQRRFDFRSVETGRVISGQVGQKLSDDYLERLHGEERISGRIYLAVMSKRTATRADSSISESFTLVDLKSPDDNSKKLSA
jgi:hypothetical protein